MRRPGGAAVALLVVAPAWALAGDRAEVAAGGPATASDAPAFVVHREAGATVHREGPPAGHTGGGGEPDCTVCHLGAPVNAPGGALRVVGLPDAVAPGSAHVLRMVLDSEDMRAAGFQMAIRDLGGHAAGRLTAHDARVAVRDSAGLAYAQHTRDGSAPADPSRAEWTVTWTAPSTAGTVEVSAAANSADGDDSPLGDLIYTTTARSVVK